MQSYFVSVYIKFRDTAGNESSCINDTITHDNTAPTSTSISIDSGATYATSTAVSLSLAATGAADMYVSNTAGCSADGTWESYATSKAWTLGQTEATATVYIKFRDAAGNESTCINDTITHDNTAPTSTSISIDSGATYATSTAVSLSLAATSAADMYVTNTSGCSADGTWESYATSKAWTLGQTNATATVYIKFRDAAGNESSCINDTITHDNTPPTSTSISIDSGATYATSTAVSLTLAATSAADMYVSNTSGCAAGGTWESYSTSKAWTLGQTEATATVYIKFRDSLGNESSCINDTITHDNTAPTSTSISIDSGATYATSTAVSLTLAATSAADMYVTNTSGCAAGGTWESYGTSKAWTLGQTNATATVYIKYRDTAGNESSCINDTITHDNTAPTSPSLSIGSGAYTSATANTLFPSATSAADMYITNTAACGSGGTWEAYATTKASWSLGQSNGTATVYAKYRDAAGNESSCINDTITHDNVSPSDPSDFEDGNSTHAASDSPAITWTASTDAVSGISQYEVSIGTSSGATDIKAWTDVGNVTSTSFSDLSLTLGDTYYTNIRAVDNATNESTEVNSDSFLYGYLQQAYLKAANNDATDEFGNSIAISGDTIVVGVYLEDSNQTTITNGTTASSNNGILDAGAVYVYKRTNGSWAQEAYIKTSNSDIGDQFGYSIDIDGDTIVVGARLEDSNQTTITNGTSTSSNDSNSDSGAAYVYTRTGSTWTQEAYIKAVNGDVDDNFGRRVAISGDTIVVGSYDESNQTTITNGTTASSDNSNYGSGAVYVYKRSGTSWAQEAYIKASNNDVEDWFGYGLDIDGDTIVVGAYYEDSNQTTITNGTSASSDNSNSKSGAAYVYKRSGSTWTQEAYLKTPNNEAGDRFGRHLVISGDTVAVSAYGEDSNQTTITNGTTASSDNSNSYAGAVFVFKRSGSTWTQEAYIKAANNDAVDAFGYGCGVAINGDTLVVGAESEDSNQTSITNGTSASSNNSSTDSGAAYVYKRSGSTWSQVAYLKASNTDSEDFYGYCVGIGSDETIIVSSSTEDSNQSTITNGTSSSSNNSNADSGAVFVYE